MVDLVCVTWSGSRVQGTPALMGGGFYFYCSGFTLTMGIYGNWCAEVDVQAYMHEGVLLGNRSWYRHPEWDLMPV